MSLRGGVRCIYMYIVVSSYIRGFSAYLHIYLYYIYCGLWPPDNTTCLFLTHATIIYFYFFKSLNGLTCGALSSSAKKNYFCYITAGRWVPPVNFRVNSGLIQNLCTLRTINKKCRGFLRLKRKVVVF
jgi:hypothetical protein